MSVKDKIFEKKKQIHQFLVNPKLVRLCIKFTVVFFPLMIFFGVLVAVFLGPVNLRISPGSGLLILAPFNIMDNYISDMGSHRYTPIPKFLDDGVMVTAIMLIPVCFYLKRLIDIKSIQLESINVSTKYSSVVLITMLIGMIGFFSVGFFSEDVAISLYPVTTSTYDLHEFFTVVQFVGIASAGLLLGILLVRYPQGIIELIAYEKMSKMIPRIMGLIMISLTPVLCTFFLLEFPPSAPFWEWMLFFSIFGWLFPIGIMTLHQINNELKLKG